MGRGSTETFFLKPRRHTDGQQAVEKILITNQEKANQNQESPHTC